MVINGAFRVFIITGLRIAALNRVNSHDFSYDQGYIGLLSILGPLIAIICCCTTASVGIVYRRLRQWAESRRFSSSRVIWSMPTRRSRWWSSMTTQKDQETKFGRGISKYETLGSVPDLGKIETKSANVETSTLTGSLTETQCATLSTTGSSLDQPTNSAKE